VSHFTYLGFQEYTPKSSVFDLGRSLYTELARHWGPCWVSNWALEQVRAVDNDMAMLPDPTDAHTFERCKLDAGERQTTMSSISCTEIFSGCDVGMLLSAPKLCVVAADRSSTLHGLPCRSAP
jgi:hypothetical protein